VEAVAAGLVGSAALWVERRQHNELFSQRMCDFYETWIEWIWWTLRCRSNEIATAPLIWLVPMVPCP
jgi:hypothetical protein